MLIAEWSVEDMTPGMSPYGMLLDVYVLSPKKGEKKIQQTSNFNLIDSWSGDSFLLLYFRYGKTDHI
jgi:hypothetical protein